MVRIKTKNMKLIQLLYVVHSVYGPWHHFKAQRGGNIWLMLKTHYVKYTWTQKQTAHDNMDFVIDLLFFLDGSFFFVGCCDENFRIVSTSMMKCVDDPKLSIKR